MLAALTAVTVVLAIKVAGIMLVSALLILPAAASLQIARGFKTALFLSALVAVFSVIFGITLSFFGDLPAGATIVMVNFTIFILLFLFKKASA